MNAGELAHRLGGSLVVPSGVVPNGDDLAVDGLAVDALTVDGLAIDSRVVRPGQLFAALSAERDGHDFVDAAFASGAAAALVERASAADSPWAGPVIVVPSVTQALAELAVFARERLFHGATSSVDAGSGTAGSGTAGSASGTPHDHITRTHITRSTDLLPDDTAAPAASVSTPSTGASTASGLDRVVGVTGSVGKTTTKDLLANVLARRFATVASEKSFNNELGVPLTLVNAPEGTEAAVIEMGARGRGHIRLLCELARPSVGIVTVIEGVHTEVMGPIEQIAIAKRELVEHLPANGLAVLNATDPNVAAMAAHTVASVLTFGGAVMSGSASGDNGVRGRSQVRGAGGPLGEVHAEDVVIDDELRARFTLRSPWGAVPVHLGVRGEHNVTNALAAAATGLWLGVDLEVVAAGLGEAPASPWRMELVRVSGGPTVLNDAYNAGPASMSAAIRSLAALSVGDGGRRVAVIGVMAELGEEGPGEHQRIGALATDLGIEVLAVGTDLYRVDWVVPDVAAAMGELSDIGAGDAVLVKGSRVAGLEQVAAALSQKPS